MSLKVHDCAVNRTTAFGCNISPDSHTLCRLEKGTTYNSYIIYGDKTALVDASHEKFRGLYMNTLKQELKSKGRTLDYIVVSHTEPDHSGGAHAPRPIITSSECGPASLQMQSPPADTTCNIACEWLSHERTGLVWVACWPLVMQ